MEQMQFSAIVLMTLLTLALVFLLPKWKSWDPIINKARRLMACASALLALQFVLQYTLGLRAMGVTQAVLLNLVVFVPCSCLFTFALLYLQRHDRLSRKDWLPWLAAYLLILMMLTVGCLASGQPLLSDAPELRWAEIGGCVIYFLIQLRSTYFCFRNMRQMRRALGEYYDRDLSEMLRWMKNSTLILATISVTAPIVIFMSGWILAIYGILFIASIFYLIFSFVCYAVSNNNELLRVAEKSAEESEEHEKAAPEMDKKDSQRIEKAVNQWIEAGGYLHNGITVQQAADKMHVPRYQLTAWLKTTEQEQFSHWLTRLRIEEAKRQMLAHPEWSNDTIAEYCGFGSRSYFQTVFRKQTGQTPSAFMENASVEKSDK